MSCRCRVVGIVVSICVVVALSPRAQAAPFVNLNFEQATVPPGTQFFLPAALAFPGWTPRLNNTALTVVHYNDIGIGEPSVTLHDIDYPSNTGIPVLEGSYGAILTRDLNGSISASLTQIGDVPPDARSLHFLGSQFRPPPLLQMNGETIPLLRLSPSGGVNDPVEWAGDITSFAGVSDVELRFVSQLPPLNGINALDAISFSPIPVPEPTSCVPIAVGVWLLERRRRVRTFLRGVGDELANDNGELGVAPASFCHSSEQCQCTRRSDN